MGGVLPFCSLVALASFGLGGGPLGVVGLFLVLYNAGHLALRAWGLTVGWRHGLRVATALAHPVLRRGPEHIVRAASLVAGVALPLALMRVIGPGRALIGGVMLAILASAVLLARLHGRAEGWRIALGLLTAFVLFSVIRHG